MHTSTGRPINPQILRSISSFAENLPSSTGSLFIRSDHDLFGSDLELSRARTPCHVVTFAFSTCEVGTAGPLANRIAAAAILRAKKLDRMGRCAIGFSRQIIQIGR